MGAGMPARRPIDQRFREKVRKARSGCHEWTGTLMPNGYGQVHLNGKTAYAHRVAWELAHGPAPSGAYVLHKCDNRKCVNPAHLFLGTFQENMDDMVNKDRHARGERSGRRKLGREQVLAIRAAIGTQTEIAARFNVSQCTVSMIRANRIWRSI